MYPNVLPLKWKMSFLAELIEIHDNKRIPLNEMERSSKQGNYPYCGANGILDYIDDYIFEGEFVLLAEDGGNFNKFKNSAYLMNGKFWVNNHAHVLRAIENKSTNLFILYVLNFYDLNPYIVGSTRKKLNQERMREIKIVLPPVEEQKKIAEVLSTVDQAIEKVGEAIEKTKRLKKGLMQELLTKGIGHKEFKKTEIGKIPKNWEVKKLEGLAVEVYRYPTYYNIEYSKEGVKEIRGELIKENGELSNDISKYRCISFQTAKKFPRTIVKKGDFVMTVRGTIGKIGRVTESLEGANITANLMRISLDQSQCDPNFYKDIFLSERFKKILSLLSPQTTIKTIQAPKLKSIKLPLPPLLEQQRIAEILNSVDKRLELLRIRKERLEKIKKGLMEDLLTGRKRVKLEA